MAQPNLDPSSTLTALPRPAEVPSFSDRPHFPRAIRAARGIAEALFSSGGAPARPERVQWLMTELDLTLLQGGWRVGGGYRLMISTVSWLAPLMVLRPRPLWRLGVSERVHALRRLERSPLASVFLAVKALLCLIYYEHPEAIRETGYELACHRGLS
jgi:hypothetical protein